MHGVERVRLIMVSALVVSHVDGDGCVKRGEEVVGACESKEERQGQKMSKKHSERWDIP